VHRRCQRRRHLQDSRPDTWSAPTPKYQQIGLLIGVVVAAAVIGFTVQVLDKPTLDAATGLVRHQIGTEVSRPHRAP